jgi:hypothetical protein
MVAKAAKGFKVLELSNETSSAAGYIPSRRKYLALRRGKFY